jgi:hypothetical protein
LSGDLWQAATEPARSARTVALLSHIRVATKLLLRVIVVLSLLVIQRFSV